MSRLTLPCLLCWLLLAGAGGPAARAQAPRRAPAQWLDEFAEKWDETAWTSGNRRGRYMRPLDDAGWQVRMRALQGLVAAGQEALPPLLAALDDPHTPTRILAAQALGYLAPLAPRDVLQAKLQSETDAAARLYLVDALGMQGRGLLEELLEAARQAERNRDVKKHMAYALERGRAAVAADVVQTLVDWDAATMDTARIGQPAPDFALAAVTGETIRLSQYRGRQAVVLVFIYGDT